jgi:hypothetical protein
VVFKAAICLADSSHPPSIMLFSPTFLPLFALAASAQRIVRFISDDGETYTGDAILPDSSTDARSSTSARVIEVCDVLYPTVLYCLLSGHQGDILTNFTITDEVKVRELSLDLHVTPSSLPIQNIVELLSPLDPLATRTVRCVRRRPFPFGRAAF